jgi:CHAD domain-containing protein
VRETVERELKLSAPPGYVLPDLPGEQLEARLFTSVYHDTSDLRLAQLGITLRRRVENGRGLWQLKLPREDARLELEQGGGPAGPPAELLDLLVAVLRGRPLQPIATLRTRRAGVRVLADGLVLGDVVFDSVALMDGRRVARSFTELEFELATGGGKAVSRIERSLRAAGARDGDGRPKVLQALEVDTALAPTTDPLVAAIQEQYLALLRHDPGTRLGSDAEDLHQFRVATRRLRAFLRAGRDVLEPEWVSAMREELRWLGGTVGPARDLDVLIEHLDVETRRLGPEDAAAGARILDELRGERVETAAAVVDALRSDRYLRLLDALEVPGPAVAATKERFRVTAASESRKLAKAGRTIGPDSSDEALHALRIQLKRARYAAELAAGGERRPAKFLRRAKALQDVLGTNQDSVVAEERLRALAHLDGGRMSLAAGRLVERERARRRAARADLPKAWAKIVRSSRRAWA